MAPRTTSTTTPPVCLKASRRQGAAADDGLDEDFTALIDLLRREEHPTVLINVKAHAQARYGRGDTPTGNKMADSHTASQAAAPGTGLPWSWLLLPTLGRQARQLPQV